MRTGIHARAAAVSCSNSREESLQRRKTSLRKDVLAAKAELTLRSFPSKWRRGLGKHPPRRTSKSQNMAGTLARHLPARKRISGRYRDVVKSCCVSHFLMNCDLIELEKKLLLWFLAFLVGSARYVIYSL